MAKSELRAAFERHKEMLSMSAIALDGVREAYTLQTELARHLARACDSASGGALPLAPLLSTARPNFIYTLHTSNRKPRQAFLRALVGQLGPEQHEQIESASAWLTELKRCEYVCQALAEMPYEKEGDVLALVYQANRMLSLSADQALSAAAKLLEDAEDAPKDAAALEAAAAACEERGGGGELARANALCGLVGLTLRLKQHLKRAYSVSDVRMQAYDPVEAVKAPERVITRVNDAEVLDTSGLWRLPSAGHKAKKARHGADGGGAAVGGEGPGAVDVPLAVVQYYWLRGLVRPDEAESACFLWPLASPALKARPCLRSLLRA